MGKFQEDRENPRYAGIAFLVRALPGPFPSLSTEVLVAEPAAVGITLVLF